MYFDNCIKRLVFCKEFMGYRGYHVLIKPIVVFQTRHAQGILPASR